MPAQTDTDGVIVVALRVADEEQAKLCYTDLFNVKSVKKTFGFEDTLNLLADFAYEEENLDPIDCFVPDLKLVFRYYTYVISMECSKAIKYQNSSAFTPSGKRMPNDLTFTPSVYDYLSGLMRKNFPGHRADQKLVQKSLGNDYMQADDGLDELEDMLFDDDDLDDDDSDLLDLDDPGDDDLFNEPDEPLFDPLDDEDDSDDDDDDGDGK
ncbi:MAG: hypothetical protein R3B47_01115 [Bacteroidia bacterium]